MQRKKMSAEEPSKSEFESILSSIKRKFDIISTNWTDDKNFEAKFRTQVPRENEDYNALCDEWVDLFSAVTATTWVKKISNTGPQIRFRKQYQCWTHPGEVQKELLFDPRRCKATLDIKVLTDNATARRKNKYIKQGLNSVVKLNFTHLHSTIPTNPFAFFVHVCEPQEETQKNVTVPIVSEGIPQIINNIVTKLKTIPPNGAKHPRIDTSEINSATPTTQGVYNQEESNIQHLDAMKLHMQSQSSQFAPIIVNVPPQYEEIVMYQPTLQFEPTQVIPTSSTFAPHVVPVSGLYLQAQNESTY